ncbi:MAG: molybdate ABC transporter substrate-binding protein [Duodenibacillus sp.]
MKISGLLFAALLAGASLTAAAGPVTVTTGAGYIKMVDALTDLYAKKTGKTVEKALGGNIGQMLSQVQQGGRVNVVISDEATLQRFTALLAERKTRLGDTPLVLIWRKGIQLSSPADIATDKVKSVVAPDKKAAIYGRAADAWLKASGLQAKVAPKFNSVSTVPQVFSYVATGNMDAGFVNLLAWRAGKDKVGGHFEIKDESARIRMVATPVAGAENDPDVKAFVKFLASDAARPVLARFGVR